MNKKLSILSVADDVISAIEVGRHIYYVAASVMDSVQELGTLKGEDKKTWVLEYLKHFIISLNQDWDFWRTLLSDFIDLAKKLFNIAKKLF